MREFNEDVEEALSETRLRVTETAYNHITTAIALFEDSAYSQACFYAITAIEEVGKARTLQLVQLEAAADEKPVEIDAKGIERFLREHRLKATRAAASGLSVNHGAVRRHGRHEGADLNLSSGVLFLAESNQWMDLRNSCIYSDVDLHSKTVDWPAKIITGDHAYYFICMALEILAKESDAGFGSPIEDFESDRGITDFQNSSEFENNMLRLLHEFMILYQGDFDESALEFFTKHPQYDQAREKVRENEVRVEEEHRDELEEAFRPMINEGKEPSDKKKENLPEGVSYEQYKESILEYMLDIGMDTPYFINPGTHPDILELRKQVQDYLEYSQ